MANPKIYLKRAKIVALSDNSKNSSELKKEKNHNFVFHRITSAANSSSNLWPKYQTEYYFAP